MDENGQEYEAGFEMDLARQIAADAVLILLRGGQRLLPRLLGRAPRRLKPGLAVGLRFRQDSVDDFL